MDDTDIRIEVFLDKAAELEKAVAAFYKMLGEINSEHAEFFDKLAEEEKTHAEALMSFSDIANSGVAEANPLRPSFMDIEEAVRYVGLEYQKLKDGRSSFEDALNVALIIETSQLEMEFTRHLVGQTDAVCELFDRITNDEQEHVERLKSYADKFGLPLT